MAWRAVWRVDDADQTQWPAGASTVFLAVLAAAYVPRAQFRCVVLWRPAGSRLPVSVDDDVLFSLRKMRHERAKMAIFLWLAPRPALAGSYLYGGRRAEKSAILNAPNSCFVLVYLVLLHLLGARVHVLSNRRAADARATRNMTQEWLKDKVPPRRGRGVA